MGTLHFTHKRCKAFTVAQTMGKVGDFMTLHEPGPLYKVENGKYLVKSVPLAVSGVWKFTLFDNTYKSYSRGICLDGDGRPSWTTTVVCVEPGEYLCIAPIDTSKIMGRVVHDLPKGGKAIIPELTGKQYIYVADGMLDVKGNQVLPEQVVIVNPQKEFEVAAIEESLIVVIWL